MATVIVSGGTTNVSTQVPATTGYLVERSGTLDVVNGGTISGKVTIGSGGVVNVDTGGETLQTNISRGGSDLVSGGTAVGTVVSWGGSGVVEAGGLASNTTVLDGGALIISSGGTADLSKILYGSKEIVSSGGTDDGAQISGGVQLDYGLTSGATAVYGAQVVESGGTASGTIVKWDGAAIVKSGGALDDVTVSRGGFVGVLAGGTLTLTTATANSGVIDLFGKSGGASAALLIDGAVALSGGGSVLLDRSANNVIGAAGAGATLTNVEDVIAGAGQIGTGNTDLTLINSGVIDGNSEHGSALVIDTGANTISNAGTLEATGHGALAISGPGTLDNSGTVQAYEAPPRGYWDYYHRGSAVVTIADIVSNTSHGSIVATGAGALVELDGAGIVSGTLKTADGGIVETVSGSTNAISAAAIAAGALIEITSGSTLTLSGGTLGAGALVETLSSGTVTVSGTVINSGTLYANGSGSVIDVAGGAVVSGGVVEVGNGIVDIASGGTANVRFAANGSGGLEIADDGTASNAYTGQISGFGGAGHTNRSQYIDLVSVTSGAGITDSYAKANAANTSGTLTVSSGATIVAEINFAGTYTAANFHLSSGAGDTVEITDPPVTSGANVALFASHIAGSFVPAAPGQCSVSALVETSQTVPPLLTHPQHG